MLTLEDSLGSDLSDETRREFVDGMKVVPMGGRQIWNTTVTDRRKHVINQGIVDQFGMRTEDGQVFGSVDATNADELTITQFKVTISMEVTEMTEAFDQYGVIPTLLSNAKGIGTGLVKHIEMYTQQFIKNGAAGTFTDGDGYTVTCQSADGLALFHAEHTINGSSTTFDNLGASSFGGTGIQESKNLFRKFLNHDGQRKNRRANAIYSTSEASNTELIEEYAIAEKHPEDALNAPNVHKGKYTHVVLDYLDTDTAGADDSSADGYWGMCVLNGPNMRLMVSKMPELMPAEQVQRTNNKLLKGQVWFGLGVYEATDATLHTA